MRISWTYSVQTGGLLILLFTYFFDEAQVPKHWCSWSRDFNRKDGKDWGLREYFSWYAGFLRRIRNLRWIWVRRVRLKCPVPWSRKLFWRVPLETWRIQGRILCEVCATKEYGSKFDEESDEVDPEPSDARFKCPAYEKEGSCKSKEVSIGNFFMGTCCEQASKVFVENEKGITTHHFGIIKQIFSPRKATESCPPILWVEFWWSTAQ